MLLPDDEGPPTTSGLNTNRFYKHKYFTNTQSHSLPYLSFKPFHRRSCYHSYHRSSRFLTLPIKSKAALFIFQFYSPQSRGPSYYSDQDSSTHPFSCFFIPHVNFITINQGLRWACKGSYDSSATVYAWLYKASPPQTRRLSSQLLFRHLTPSAQHLVAENTYEHHASSPAELYQHSPIQSAPFHQPLGRKTRLRFADSWRIQLCRGTQPGSPIEGALLTEDSLLRFASSASYWY